MGKLENAGPPGGTNAGEIRRLRRRKALTRSLLYGSMAFMPLSCLGGFGLAALVRQESVQAVLFGFALLAPFVGLGGLLLMWGDRHRYGRSLDLALEADRLGLAYTEKPAEKQLNLFRSFQVFHDPTNEFALNRLAGRYQGALVVLLDYSCSWGPGRFAYVVRQTAIVLQAVLPRVPDLLLYPKSFMGQLAEAVGLGDRPVPVPGHKEFNGVYGLYAAQGKEAVACLTPALAALCVQEGTLVAEVSDGSLLVYWRETYLPPGELQARLDTALEVARLLRQAG
jgi:hypothetical protein